MSETFPPNACTFALISRQSGRVLASAWGPLYPLGTERGILATVRAMFEHLGAEVPPMNVASSADPFASVDLFRMDAAEVGPWDIAAHDADLVTQSGHLVASIAFGSWRWEPAAWTEPAPA